MNQTQCNIIKKNLSTSDDPAIVCGTNIISYAQLVHAIDNCTDQLKNHGVGAGHRVALISSNNPDYIIILLSLWSMNAIACPLNVRLPQEALESQCLQIHAQFLITSQHNYLTSEKILINKINFSDILTGNIQSSNKHHIVKNFDVDQYATILFTSGTNSQPKAVLHSLGSHIYSAQGSNDLIPLEKGDQWLLTLPIYHVGGLSIIFRTLLGGCTIVIPEHQENIHQAILRYNITHISIVPTQLQRLLLDDSACKKLKNYTSILVGGSAISKSLLQQSLKLKLPVYTTYGLTEIASQVATGKYPSSARILNYREIKISHDHEIFVGGNTLFQGYLDDQKINLPLTREGWFATGDLGDLDDEGGLNVTGRKDNMFISGGENIQPEEIEHYLYQLEPIEEAVVVPIASEEFGARPIAFIKIKSRYKIKMEDLLTHLKNHLPNYKIPNTYYSWPTGAEENSLKVDRKFLIGKAQKDLNTLKQYL